MNGNYYSLSDYLKEKFGEKIYKISLDLGLTCPNRDGTLDTRGCSFCLEGSSHFAAREDSIDDRIEAAKELIRKKTDARRFIAYFQSYTNTYAPTDYLEKIFSSVIKREDIVAISIGTRPDCLPPETVEMLARLNKIKPVWIELGLQTANEKTALQIRRCYENSVYTDAVRRLSKRGIDVITHIIIGLPGEDVADALNSVDLAVSSGTKGIKLQLLHVLRSTDLAADYESGSFTTLSLDEYIDILFACIERIPKDIVIHRITGDPPKSHLIAPAWSADKKRVMNTINRELKTRNITQGKNVKK